MNKRKAWVKCPETKTVQQMERCTSCKYYNTEVSILNCRYNAEMNKKLRENKKCLANTTTVSQDI